MRDRYALTYVKRVRSVKKRRHMNGDGKVVQSCGSLYWCASRIDSVSPFSQAGRQNVGAHRKGLDDVVCSADLGSSFLAPPLVSSGSFP